MEIRNVDEDVERSEPSCIAGGNVRLGQPLWKSLVVLYNKKLKLSYDLKNSVPKYIPKRIKARTQLDPGMPMFTAALFTLAKRQEQPCVRQQINE